MTERIRLRRDTAYNWKTNNPILGSGEPGVELDSNQMKIGNGHDTWDILPYISGGVAGVELKIGDGLVDQISWNLSQRLNIRGSGNTSILFDDANNTILISGSYGGGGGGLNYIAGPGIDINGPNISNTGVLSFNGRRADILLNTEDIRQILPQISGHSNIRDLSLSPSGVGNIGIGSGIPEYGLDIFTVSNFRKQAIFNSGINIFNSPLGDTAIPFFIRASSSTTNDYSASLCRIESPLYETYLDIKKDGNMAIGPVGGIGYSHRLTIKGTSSSAPLAALSVINSVNNSLLFVRNDGNVGIGTQSPSGKLHVAGTGYFTDNIFVGQMPVSLSGHTHSMDSITNLNNTLTTTVKTTGNQTIDGIKTFSNMIIVDSLSINNKNISYSPYTTGTSFGSIIPVEGSCLVAGGVNNKYSAIVGGQSHLDVSILGYSLVGGGSGNIVGGQGYNINLGGVTNSCSGTYNSIIGGLSNKTSRLVTNTTILGGQNNISSGNYSTILGGSNNSTSARAIMSCVIAGVSATTSRYAEVAHSAGGFSVAGDSQHSILIARTLTTGNNVVDQRMFLDGYVGDTGLGSTRPNPETISIRPTTAFIFSIKLIAYSNTDNAVAGWIFRGVIKRDSSNNTSLVGSVISESWKDLAMDTTSARIVANDVDECLDILVTGIANKDIRWTAVIDMCQVAF